MSLDDIRDKSRAAIHGKFALPAVVRSCKGGVEIPLTARLHIDLNNAFGDLDRQGFGKRQEFDNQVIFDTVQWMPQENWTVDFGRGRVYEIINIVDGTGHRYVRCEVSEAK